jgi:hypothetical protein
VTNQPKTIRHPSTEVLQPHAIGSRAALDDLFAEWIIELRGKGRSPNTVHGYELVDKRNTSVVQHDAGPNLAPSRGAGNELECQRRPHDEVESPSPARPDPHRRVVLVEASLEQD